MRHRAVFIALGIAGWLLCTGAGRAASRQPLRVFAASSLTDAFQEIGVLFEKSPNGCPVELNFAGSQILRSQIEQGALADVFAPADVATAEALTRAGLLEPAAIFAHTDLVVVLPAAGAPVRTLCGLATPGVRIVVADPAVPIGRYTEQVWSRLASAGLCGPDFVRRMQENVVSQETNVRAVLSKVSLGEADGGFVYRTDTGSSKSVRVIEIPPACNVSAAYPIATLKKPSDKTTADAFVRLVLSAEGQAVLARHGFSR